MNHRRRGSSADEYKEKIYNIVATTTEKNIERLAANRTDHKSSDDGN
jgi:hypothetical protein